MGEAEKVEKRVKIGFGDPYDHAKPCFNCLLPVQPRQGPPCGLKPLTRLNWRASPMVPRTV
jgi:hypothetical protein